MHLKSFRQIRKTWWLVLLGGSIALLLSACASSNLPLAPSVPQLSAAFHEKLKNYDYSYIIAPGDTLQIAVWRNPELTVTIPVKPDGKISIPLVSEMLASGKNAQTLSKDIEVALSRFIKKPMVTVLITSFAGQYNQQIRIVGEATKPMVLPYRSGLTLLDAMISAGGITEFANGNQAVLLRRLEDDTQYRVRLTDLLKRGDITANIELLPGDVLIIPEGFF